MNITKDFYDYVNNNKSVIPQFYFKCENYSPMYKCNRLLRQINEVENNIEQLTLISKKSSSFNDSHLKFSSVSISIKKALIEIENEMKNLKNKDIKNIKTNKFEKILIDNSLDILRNKTSDLTVKFQKFLQQQANTIKKVEERKNNLSLGSKKNIRTITSFNEYALDYNKNDEEDILLNITGQNTQTSMNKNTEIYSKRLGEVNSIEKTMGEISGMMNRLSQMTYAHTLMIDNISKNTDITLGNVEAGAKEVKGIKEIVQSNRALLIRIFIILIVVSVVYIIFLA